LTKAHQSRRLSKIMESRVGLLPTTNKVSANKKVF
jgi:hypothetical protein